MGYHITTKMNKICVTMWINFIKLSKKRKTRVYDKKKRVYVLHDFTYIRSRQNQYILMTAIRGCGLGLVIRRKQDRGSHGAGNICFFFCTLTT